MKTTVEARFWAKIEKTAGCWLWTARATNQDGYGRFHAIDRMVAAHRYSWEIHRGTIPEGQFVCHRCDNPKCVRPDHLFLGTHVENMNDMVAKGRSPHPAEKTNCPKGHAYTPDNILRDTDGYKRCRECRRLQHKNSHSERQRARRRMRGGV